MPPRVKLAFPLSIVAPEPSAMDRNRARIEAVSKAAGKLPSRLPFKHTDEKGDDNGPYALELSRFKRQSETLISAKQGAPTHGVLLPVPLDMLKAIDEIVIEYMRGGAVYEGSPSVPNRTLIMLSLLGEALTARGKVPAAEPETLPEPAPKKRKLNKKR